VRSGSEPDDEQPRFGISKAWDRPAPIFLAAVSTPPYETDVLAMSDKARAAATPDDFLV